MIAWFRAILRDKRWKNLQISTWNALTRNQCKFIDLYGKTFRKKYEDTKRTTTALSSKLGKVLFVQFSTNI